jgi:predicted HicB family RNase H-like nuclease
MATSSTINFAETRESMGDDFNNVNFRLNQFGHDLEQMKNEFAKWLKEMQDSLNQKADIEALSNLEKTLMERMNEIVKALIKQLADKNDTKKALKLLERQLKNLYDLFMSRGHNHNENEDDAMFTKKPLGGMSCASCEKDIINLQGKKADYLPWSKFPFRDPSERIAKVI